jgi:hypothetical protein
MKLPNTMVDAIDKFRKKNVYGEIMMSMLRGIIWQLGKW